MNKTIKLSEITYDIDGMELNDLSSWIKKQQEIYNTYDKLFVEMERDYGYDQGDERDALMLYGIRPETKSEETARMAAHKKLQVECKAKRKIEWEKLNEEFGDDKD